MDIMVNDLIPHGFPQHGRLIQGDGCLPQCLRYFPQFFTTISVADESKVSGMFSPGGASSTLGKTISDGNTYTASLNPLASDPTMGVNS